ncbi:hypothetical protein BGW36DRAFT_34911 [Talaromyces proteolyticus]|uniref:Uncharacterized protein n=1 Tax=Talaromyces proteolyticus TaxID=1131652 RepID=A0AAD4PXH2_9EURO|nr:uncharacterized protein BGW36DRAFT_34911 [Talaromyces proteolyticus]KAH8693136.1 hypothetical protein BGW36DRAFT_34911 [Talaromyces proteolyticus]
MPTISGSSNRTKYMPGGIQEYRLNVKVIKSRLRGHLDSPITHHLHQPSFTTNAPGDKHSTADTSNGCIAMVMGNRFQERNTLLFDHLHRQSARSNGPKPFPEPIKIIHEELTHLMMASSAAKFETVYGLHVQKRILQLLKCSLLPLWGRCKGVFLALDHEGKFHNEENRFRSGA